jgi:hypothetical protein
MTGLLLDVDGITPPDAGGTGPGGTSVPGGVRRLPTPLMRSTTVPRFTGDGATIVGGGGRGPTSGGEVICVDEDIVVDG